MNETQRQEAVAFDSRQALDVLGDVRTVLGVPGATNSYDGMLVEAIAELQAQQGLKIDGKIGPRTRELLSRKLPEVDASMLWPPSDADDAQKNLHYRSICERLGETVPTNRPLLLAYRGVALRAFTTHPVVSHPEYDDGFILLQIVGGAPRVKEFAGATHPYQRNTGAAPDTNLDGTPDVGTIRPGRYLLERLPSDADHPKLWVKRTPKDARIPTWRDTNQDGTISAKESEVSEGKTSGPQAAPGVGDFSTEVLLHPGFTAKQTNGRPYSSIGCQTARLEDVRDVADCVSLDYLLIDGRRAALKVAAQGSA